MIEVVGIRFKKAGKLYYFDPDGLEIKDDTYVIVETARGVEYGLATKGNHEVNDNEIVPPLKKVIRIATEEDAVTNERNRDREKEAFAICEEKILNHGLDMKLVDVEYTFDQNKI